MDVIESFAAVKAGHRETWSFVTRVDRIRMWTMPVVDLVVPQGESVLDVGSHLDLLFCLPGRPALHGLVLSLSEDAIAVKLDGFMSGLATWRAVPAGDGVIVHGQVRYKMTDWRRMWAWMLGGRWLGVFCVNWMMRQLKARVEDTVGSSSFGAPVRVSPYAVILSVVLTGFFWGVFVLHAKRWRNVMK